MLTRSSRHRKYSRQCVCRALVLWTMTGLGFLTASGCSSRLAQFTRHRWVADYEVAERRSDEVNQEILIFYLDDRLNRDRQIEDALRTQEVKDLADDYIACTLVRSYEPDRRYVAQYGVTNAPALIVVHRDGTYHATSQATTTPGILRFLAEAQAPGQAPSINPYLPRRVEYTWVDSLDVAQQKASESGQPMLVVFYRRASGDWRQLSKLLERREVGRRVSDMVHCRVRLAWPWSKAYITRFGALKLPAVVIAHPDGSFDSIELPTSYEVIVRLADSVNQPTSKSQTAYEASNDAVP